MSTTSNKDIKDFFDGFFKSESYNEHIEREALMLHYRVMQLVEKAMDEKGWNKKVLAEKTGKSQSYITQLFMGNKMVNMSIIALFQDVFNMEFKMETELSEEKCITWKYIKQKPSNNKYMKLSKASSILKAAEDKINYELTA